MSHQEALGLARGLLGGGLDTVAARMGWIAMLLAQNPGHRRELAANPARLPKAIDELMRRDSIANIARAVRHDMDYLGASLKAGEQILMATCIHGLEERSSTVRAKCISIATTATATRRSVMGSIAASAHRGRS